MADITQDSFQAYAYARFQDALNTGTPVGGGSWGPFTKVIAQRGRDVRDSELNELQDIQRVFLLTTMYAGMQEAAGSGSLNPGSNDSGFLCVGSGAANSVVLQTGFLFVDGIPLELTNAFTFSGFATRGSDGTDAVYLAVQEVEVADPSVVPQLGPTSTRRQLSVSVNVSTTGPSTGPGTGGVPPNSASPIWQGGTHYFVIANVARRSGDPDIQLADVTDARALLLPTVIASVFTQAAGVVTKLTIPLIEVPHSYDYAFQTAQTEDVSQPILPIANGGTSWTDGLSSGIAIAGPQSLRTAAPLMCALTKIRNRSTLASVDVYFAVKGPHSAVPAILPDVIVYRRHRYSPSARMGLSGNITSGATAFTVYNTPPYGGLPAACPSPTFEYVIQIDSEQILVTASTGGNITACTRGANGTAAASHLLGATVFLKSWADTLENINLGGTPSFPPTPATHNVWDQNQLIQSWNVSVDPTLGIIDTTQFEYLAQIIEEQGSNSVAGNVYTGFMLHHTNVNDIGF